MNIDNAVTILLLFASCSIGAAFGILRNKIFSLTGNKNLPNAFYILTIIEGLFSIFVIVFYWKILIEPNYFVLTVLVLSIMSNTYLFMTVKAYLISKEIYETKELDPVVNSFTKDADRKNIKLFAGDLNFFGNIPTEMDTNVQYTCLKGARFKKIEILCEEPNDISDKIRYGKILTDMPETEMRFYKPEEADLMIRGRMKELNNVVRLLIYTKIKTGKYKAVEIDTANSSGAMYTNIWKLVGNQATRLASEQADEYKSYVKQ